MNDQRWLDQMGTESPVMHPSHLAQKWQVLRMVLQGRSDGDRVRSLPSEIKLEWDLHRGDSTECAEVPGQAQHCQCSISAGFKTMKWFV